VRRGRGLIIKVNVHVLSKTSECRPSCRTYMLHAAAEFDIEMCESKLRLYISVPGIGTVSLVSISVTAILSNYVES